MNPVLLHRPMRSRSAAGFTLVEMLVVLTLVGLLVSALFGVVRFGSGAMDRTRTASGDSQQMEAVHRFLRRTLAATGDTAIGLNESPQPTLIGAGNRMEFATTMPHHLALGGTARLALHADAAGGAATLRAAWQPVVPNPRQPIPAIVETLASGLAAVDFAYFGNADADGDVRWIDSWTVTDRLPLLVRMRVVGRDGRPWPDLVVALRYPARRDVMSGLPP